MRTKRPRHTLLVGLIGLIGLVFAGCATAASPAATARPVGSPSSPAPSMHGSARSVAPATNLPEAWLLVGRVGDPGFQLITTGTAEVVLELPSGAPDPKWHRLVTATADGSGTTISDQIVQPGLGGPRLDIDGAWQLPTIGDDPLPGGVSLDGSTIALVARGTGTQSADPVSRFAIVSHVLASRLTSAREADLRLERVIELPGAFDYDTLSPDGRILYVAQHLPGAAGAYQVRAIDVSSGKMREAVIVDKRNIDETMAGWPIAQLRRPDGVVMTLYRGAEHPFVHALQTIDAWAVCIDLPASGVLDAAPARDWGLAPSGDGRSVYAINGSLGIAVEIDPSELTIRRTSVLKTASTGATRSPSIVLAKFGHGEVGSAGRLVVAPDGKTVWTATANGLLAIDARDLSVNRRLLEGSAVDGVAIAPDGSFVFALIRDGGRIVALDPATGRTLGTVPGGGFDRLFATAPW